MNPWCLSHTTVRCEGLLNDDFRLCDGGPDPISGAGLADGARRLHRRRGLGAGAVGLASGLVHRCHRHPGCGLGGVAFSPSGSDAGRFSKPKDRLLCRRGPERRRLFGHHRLPLVQRRRGRARLRHDPGRGRVAARQSSHAPHPAPVVVSRHSARPVFRRSADRDRDHRPETSRAAHHGRGAALHDPPGRGRASELDDDLGAPGRQQGGPRGTHQGQCRKRRQVRLPGRGQPRDPHPHERGGLRRQSVAANPARRRTARACDDADRCGRRAGQPAGRRARLLQDRGRQDGVAARDDGRPSPADLVAASVGAASRGQRRAAELRYRRGNAGLRPNRSSAVANRSCSTCCPMR